MIETHRESDDMQIEIKFWGNLGYHVPEARGKFSLKKSFDREKTVDKLVEELGLPVGLDFIITVNGRVVEGEYVLVDGDSVAFFRPVSGG